MNPRFTLPTPADLQPWLERATEATGTRKALADPVKAGRVAYERRNRRMPVLEIAPDKTLTTYKRLSSYLRAVAVRALADLARKRHLAPDVDQLADELAAFAWEHHRDLILVQAPGEPRESGLRGWTFVDERGVDAAARQAATKALASLAWRPGELYARQSAGGSKGRADGVSKGPKPKSATPQNGAKALALRDLGMSQRAIAADLGVSVATVNKLLRAS